MSSFNLREFRSNELECDCNCEETLGQGGFGTVVLAFHPIHNILAIKCFERIGGPKKVKVLEKKFQREFENLQIANHDNVVRVLGWIKNTHLFGIVMEYLPGGNLMELVEDEDVEVRSLLKLRISAEVANGLSFLHNFSEESRLVHGDIKPENVLLTEDLHCKIADFGSAKISTYTGSLKLTKTGAPFEKTNQFTEFYAAPELLRNPLMKQEPSLDTYSYGMVVYILLGREVPNVNRDLFKQSILNGERPNHDNIISIQNRLKEDVAIRVTEVLMWAMTDCWQQEPSSRPPMLFVREKLYRVLAQIPTAEILRSAMDAVRGMDVCKPLKQKYKCIPFYELQLFHSPKSTSSVQFSGTAVLPTMVRDATDESIQLARSIKSSLERTEVDKAVSLTMQLLSVDSSSPTTDAVIDDVMTACRSLNDKSEYVTSLKLIGWCLGVCGNIETAEVKFRRLFDCGHVINDTARVMFNANNKGYIEQHCAPLLIKLLENLKVIHITDTKFKAKMETWCLLYIGRCNYYVGKHEQAIKIANTCVSNVTTLLGKEAVKCLLLPSCHELLAASHHNTGDYESAVAWCKLQIGALRSAEGVSEEKKMKWIAQADQHLSRWNLISSSNFKTLLT